MNLKQHPRSAGFVLFVFSLSVFVWYYAYIMDVASRHERGGFVVPGAFFLLAPLVLLGLSLMAFGKKVQSYSAGLRNRKKTVKDFLIIGFLVFPAFIAFFVVQQKLAQLGYAF